MSFKAKKPFDWSPEAIEMLRHLWCELGCSISQIAFDLSNRFGVKTTRNAVIGKIHRIGLVKAEAIARRKPVRMKKAKPSTIPVVKDSLATELSGNSGKLDIVPVLRAPEPAIDIHFDGSSLIGLLNLRETTCRWPVGDPREKGFGFCGADAPIGSPYCQHHHKIAYVPQQNAKPRKSGDHHGMRFIQMASL